ncbi:SoxR reducing system RseC family protein [Helcococcus ovis]|uniref:SoxR reducing system RseC family protein n=1 Tax=Helcococcus ovis TaxID=72026 RepID=UPI0038BA9AAD
MNKVGVITKVDDDKAVVMMVSSKTCGDCGCSTLTKIHHAKSCEYGKKYLIVQNTINAKVGDPVNLEFKTTKMLKASLVLYILPLIIMVVGILISNKLQGKNPSDIISFISGITALVVSYAMLSSFDKKEDRENLIKLSKFRGY